MKKFFLLIFCSIISFPIFSVGYNVNFEFDAGISECFFGPQVKENRNFWQDFNNFSDYLTTSGAVSADIVINKDFSIITGLQFSHLQLNYFTIDGNEYGNDAVQLRYSILQIPVMAKHDFVIKKTTEIIDSIGLASGLNVSFVTGKQTYKDLVTDYVGNFISSPFNFGLSLKTTYSHKIGPGNVFMGIKADINLLSQKYTINGNSVNFGNVMSVYPVIGYTFILKKDRELAKITEKNKRIKDIDVN